MSDTTGRTNNQETYHTLDSTARGTIGGAHGDQINHKSQESKHHGGPFEGASEDALKAHRHEREFVEAAPRGGVRNEPKMPPSYPENKNVHRGAEIDEQLKREDEEQVKAKGGYDGVNHR
ncbi:hypothetical protein BT69DRAFT_1316879 [Atractiella rhizophila]|nr:hypothetical protein BT69DRAFT_1316879 [Atractiella rhizophila]